MIIYAFMTYRLDVHYMFEEITVMVRPSQAKYLINVYMNNITIISFITLKGYTKLWVVILRLACKSGLDLGTAPFEMKILGYNHREGSLCVLLEGHNHNLAGLCMGLWAQVREKKYPYQGLVTQGVSLVPMCPISLEECL